MGTKLHAEVSADLATQKHGKFEVLPAILLYGANASGKSNVLNALIFMKNFILRSHTGTTEARGTNRPYFRLNKVGENEPSQFDCDFVLDNVRYHYGFKVDDESVTREWLYSYPDNRRNVLFLREGEILSILGQASQKSLKDEWLISFSGKIAFSCLLRPRITWS